MNRLACAALLLMGLAGCAGKPPPDATVAVAPTPVGDVQQSLPPTFDVATPAPGPRLQVRGGTLVLHEAGSERRLRIERNEALFDGRVVTARDAAGVVEVRITARLCFGDGDAQSPYTARVLIGDAAPVMGCGGPP